MNAIVYKLWHFIYRQSLNLLISVIAASGAIVITAAIIAVNTNENVVKRAVQSVILSLAASGATFFIGTLVSSYLHVAV